MSERYTSPSTDPKPTDCLEMGGAELLLPAVQEIKEALASGETFIVVGGGGSGKSESMATAFESGRVNHETLDLRNWTVTQLADESIRSASLDDPMIDAQAKAYIAKLHSLLSTELDADVTKSTVKHDYWADETYGIKYAESYLLDRALEQAGEDAGVDKGKSAPFVAPHVKNVLVLDEFDLGIGETLAPVEIENAAKLIQLAKLTSDASQLGLIIHPAAVKDKEFTAAVRDALGRQGEVHTIMMQYFPRQVEAAALEKIGITGQEAKDFMQTTQGLPSAYLDICTNPELVKELTAASPNERIAALKEKVENKLARNKPIIFDRLSEETKKYLIDLIQGAQPADANPKVIQEALVNLYVSERDGDVTMPPMVRVVLARELGIG